MSLKIKVRDHAVQLRLNFGNFWFTEELGSGNLSLLMPEFSSVDLAFFVRFLR